MGGGEGGPFRADHLPGEMSHPILRIRCLRGNGHIEKARHLCLAAGGVRKQCVSERGNPRARRLHVRNAGIDLESSFPLLDSLYRS